MHEVPVAAALALVLIYGCAPVPPESPSGPRTAAPTVAAAKPAPTAGALRGSVIGRYGDRVVLIVARSSPGGDLTYTVETVGEGQSALTALAARPDLAMDRAVSDGSSLVLGLQAADGPAPELVVVSPGYEASEVELGSEPWVDEWRFWGGIVPLAEGGFLLTGIPRLVTLDVSGSIADAALPAGWIVQAPTSDPDLVLVGRLGSDNGPESRSSAATGLHLYRRSTGEVSADPAADVQVVAVSPATAGLAYLKGADGGWLVLGNDLRLVMASEPTEAASWISADGGLLAVEATGTLGPCVTEAGCGVMLVDLPTSEVLGRGPGPVASDVVFDGRSIRYVVGDLLNGPTVVTVNEGGFSQVGL
jgi:hypothetical protein